MVVRTETWMVVTKTVAGGTMVSWSWDNQFSHADFSVTEAGQKIWWSTVQGCGPGCVQGSVQGSFCEVLENEIEKVFGR